jgi:hypothetical protein
MSIYSGSSAVRNAKRTLMAKYGKQTAESETVNSTAQ